MNEAAPAHKTFARVITKIHSVNGIEIFITRTKTHTWRAELACTAAAIDPDGYTV